MNRPITSPTQSFPRSQHIYRAALYEEFLRMRDQEHFTVTGAARTLGIPASSVSGEGSMLSRYIRGGLAGLERHGGVAGAGSLSRRIEALGWFIY
jgi:hypothetical protein